MSNFDDIRKESIIPAFCPACSKLMDNWSAKNYFKNYVCSDCFITYIEGRDISDEIRKDKYKIQEYVKNKIKENNS